MTTTETITDITSISTQETVDYDDQELRDFLWQMIDQHRLSSSAKDLEDKRHDTTWELVIIQGVLLTLLVVLALVWIVIFRKKCMKRNEELTVADALRKVSLSKRDLPPSYSQMDIHTLGISVNDYLNPPPNYIDLQYLDLEAGHNRLAKLSFCNDDGSLPRLARLSVASCENCSSESAVVVPTADPCRPERLSVSSSSSDGSRRPSRTSRVSFSEEVEYSNGSIRKLSGLKSQSGSNSSSRKSSSSSSSSSEGSRKSSLKSHLQRKFGSSSSEGHGDSFVANLDPELRRKLEAMESDTKIQESESEAASSSCPTPSSPSSSSCSTPVTAQAQAERAARICDIIVEGREK